MYRFPLNLNLDLIKTDSLDQIRSGIGDVQLSFSSGVTIVVQSRIEVWHKNVNIVNWDSANLWSSADFQNLISRTVNTYCVLNPRTLQFTFEDEYELRIYDDSDQFESATIYIPNDTSSPIVV